MASFQIELVRTPTTRNALAALAAAGFGELLKAVIDVERGVMAIGGELHSDEEAALLDDGSRRGTRDAIRRVLRTLVVDA